MEIVKILILGDVVGKPGRQACLGLIPKLKDKHDIDFVIINGENIANGSSVTAETIEELFHSGADVITSGDHIFRKKEGVQVVKDNPRVLRPLNYPKEAPGNGQVVVTTSKGVKIGVVNIMGRVFLESIDCPFRAVDQAIDSLKGQTKIIIVDVHAEATSEKIAMGWYLDGRVSGVVGTHTHVQTADETVLPKGTAYMTDLGMTGPHKSVIGRDIDQVLWRFKMSMPGPMEVATQDIQLCGALIEVEVNTGKAKSITRIREALE